ncbi:hypothetical protein RQP46_004344 [Phenoliferia psychrophenolica]
MGFVTTAPEPDADINVHDDGGRGHDDDTNDPFPIDSPISQSLNNSSSTTMSRSISSVSSTSSLRHHPYSSTRSTRPRSTTSRSASESSRTGSGTDDDDDDDYADSLPEVSTMELDDAPYSPPNRITTSLSTAGSGAARVKKPKASHARKQSPDHIKRPPNAFIIFRSHCCNPTDSGEAPDAPGTPTALQLAELEITDHRHISRIASYLWKNLKPVEKSYWESRAKERKEEHARLYPGYKYKPVFRNKDEIRRRKNLHAEEIETEKRGCEEVARALMAAHPNQGTDRALTPYAPPSATPDDNNGGGVQQQRSQPVVAPRDEFRASQSIVSGAPASIWTIDQVKPLAAALSNGAVLESPKRKRVRGPTAAQRRRQQEEELALSQSQSQQSSVNSSYPMHPLDPRHPAPRNDYRPVDPRVVESWSTHDGFRPQSAPPSEYPIEYYQRRRNSHVRTSSYQTEAAPYGYIGGSQEPYDAGYGQYQQQQRAVSSQPYPSSNQHAMYSPPQPSRRAPPAPLALPHNPTFLYYQAPQQQQQQQNEQRQHPPPRPSTADSHALALQNYSIDPQQPSDGRHHSPLHDAILSPTGTTFTYEHFSSNGGGPTDPSAVVADPHPNFALAGMRRRGTLGRTEQGNELMLISPTGGAFPSAGRRFSAGRWEVRKVSVDGHQQHHSHHGPNRPHPLSQQQEFSPNSSKGAADSFNFQTDFMHGARDQDSDRRSEHSNESSSLYASQPQRPGSSHSDYSSEGEAPPIQREEGGEGEYWRRAATAGDGSTDPKDDRPFHVGHSDFFLAPEPALGGPTTSSSSSTSSSSDARPFEYAQAPNNGTMFNYPSFGSSFSSQDEQSRPSIDALLAADAYAPYAHAYQHGGPSEEWLSNRVGRDSEATIKWNPRRGSVIPDDEDQDEDHLDEDDEDQEDMIRISELSSTREGALEVLDQARKAADSLEGEGPKYIYLSKELANDSTLIDQILQCGFGVTYDNAGSSVPSEYDPQTARQPTFDSSATSLTSPPASFPVF